LDPPVIYTERQRESVFFFFPRWKQRGGKMTAGAVPPAGCRRPGGGGAARELHGGEAHPWPLAARPAAVRGPLATRARTHGGGFAAAAVRRRGPASTDDGRGTGKRKGVRANSKVIAARPVMAHGLLAAHTGVRDGHGTGGCAPQR
jgi:hypothetical protein